MRRIPQCVTDFMYILYYITITSVNYFFVILSNWFIFFIRNLYIMYITYKKNVFSLASLTFFSAPLRRIFSLQITTSIPKSVIITKNTTKQNSVYPIALPELEIY